MNQKNSTQEHKSRDSRITASYILLGIVVVLIIGVKCFLD